MLKDSKHPFSGVLFLAFLRERGEGVQRPFHRSVATYVFPAREKALRIAFGGFTPCVSCAGD